MKATTIEDALNKRPFAAFAMKLDNGEAIRVRHPDCLLFNQSRTTAVVAGSDDHLHIVDVDHVSSVSFLKRKVA